MERVQFQQEQMLSELKDLVQKGLFTQNETKHIMKKRTAYETPLVRRIPKKADFLRYAAYEMGLETLRRKRVERLNLQKSEPSISDYALVRRQFHIFERALKKFKGDVGLWIQYIELAKKEGAKALVGRITARALQLHPTHPPLYVLAAQHELSRLSPSAARTLLQRGIRMNPESVEMWREYVKMEMGWVESVRRRWSVLGLDTKGKVKEKQRKVIGQVLGGDKEGVGEDVGVDEDGMDEDGGGEAERGDESEEARRQILDGAIVKAVISNAVKALPNLSLFSSLHDLLTAYPSPPSLRASFLEHLYTLLRETLSTEPGAVRLLAQRFFHDKDADLVDALRSANEAMARGVKEIWGAEQVRISKKGEDRGQAMEKEYVEFVVSWCNKEDLDENLKLYLLSSLHSLVSQSSSPSPILLAAHLRLLLQLRPSTYPDKKLLKLARKYASQQQQSQDQDGWPQVWLARLEIESEFSGGQEVLKVWEEARKAVSGENEADSAAVKQVWAWGLERMEEDSAATRAEKIRLVEVSSGRSDTRALALLRESMRGERLRGVHDDLLLRYVALHQKPPQVADARLVRGLAREYFVSARVWGEVFRLLSGCEDAEAVEAVHEEWRRVDAVAACVQYAGWLVGRGRGEKVGEVIARGRVVCGDGRRAELEERWREVLDAPRAQEDEGAEE
ncbi:hypothetical protein NEOLEDRAFT_1155534 [Neolentinus lepideus HHB14362 ss-1]|uniref:U3 small nucleolar RNA-associated protein 6 N-terminal domain-containing protein n=1 Tax=Neolentinus lepideus HHB14362 ss-1 TaxID=1314782 RepID=A0A165TKW3_9AGAM|nr:hypothetical protein NEOLEDRAFT_1155534 [Neolentinus lepideus HHB14362 ss-1]